MSNWSGVSQAYKESFALLCAGTEDRILGDLVDGPVLDVGSGTGTLTRAFFEKGLDVTAVDSNPDMVAMTNQEVPGSCTLHALPQLPSPITPSVRCSPTSSSTICPILALGSVSWPASPHLVVDWP